MAWSHTKVIYTPEDGHPIIPVLTGLNVEQLRSCDERRYHYAKPPTHFLQPSRRECWYSYNILTTYEKTSDDCAVNESLIVTWTRPCCSVIDVLVRHVNLPSTNTTSNSHRIFCHSAQIIVNQYYRYTKSISGYTTGV